MKISVQCYRCKETIEGIKLSPESASSDVKTQLAAAGWGLVNKEPICKICATESAGELIGQVSFGTLAIRDGEKIKCSPECPLLLDGPSCLLQPEATALPISACPSIQSVKDEGRLQKLRDLNQHLGQSVKTLTENGACIQCGRPASIELDNGDFLCEEDAKAYGMSPHIRLGPS